MFLEEFSAVEEHLSLVFHRYLEKKKIKIWINDLQIKPWDPFMKDSEGGQLICDELLGVNLSNVYDKTTTRKLAWAELKTRGKSI